MSFKDEIYLSNQEMHIRFILRSLKAFPASHPTGEKIYEMLAEFAESIFDEDFDGRPIIDLMLKEVFNPIYSEQEIL
ncbi:MAG: hypothetical protein K2Y28_06165 [Burkholderiaceae bacterium]|nr:hypothetical protein [Burkholderiaceae bacterium]